MGNASFLQVNRNKLSTICVLLHTPDNSSVQNTAFGCYFVVVVFFVFFLFLYNDDGLAFYIPFNLI